MSQLLTVSNFNNFAIHVGDLDVLDSQLREWTSTCYNINLWCPVCYCFVHYLSFLLHVTPLIYLGRFIIFIKWVLNTLTVILFIERQSPLSAPLLLILSLACVAIKKKSPLFLLINLLITFSNISLVKIMSQNILWSNFYLQLCMGNNLSW